MRNQIIELYLKLESTKVDLSIESNKMVICKIKCELGMKSILNNINRI